MIAALREKWKEGSERPFFRLTRLFIDRIFQGNGETDGEQLDFSLGLVLSVLTIPGAFYSIFLLDKYGTLLQWAMGGHGHIDTFKAAMPDEYFLIVLSMVVSGMAAVWRWGSIFPDRRDYANLAPLPIPMAMIFFANFAAIIFIAAMLAFDVNLVSSFMFPLVVSAWQESFSYFFHFAGVHILVVLLAGLFSFFAVFAVVGVLMIALPYQVFRRVSLYLRGAMMACFLAILSTSFVVPSEVARLPQLAIRFLPTVWFLGLCQSLRNRASPSLAGLGHFALISTAGIVVLASIVYAISYRRCFIRIPEMADVVSDNHRYGAWIFALLDHTILRSPFQSAGYRFIVRTLLRSERHSLIFGGFLSFGVVAASQVLFSAFTENDVGTGEASPRILAIPFILSYCIIVGLRFAFEIPAELRPNWIFKFLLDKNMAECVPLARKVLLMFVLPWGVLIVLPLHVYFWGWRDGWLHLALLTTWSVLLANILLVKFHKIPFTCTYPAFRHSAIVSAVSGLLGLFVFAFVTAQFEYRMLRYPVLGLMLLPLIFGTWYALARFRSGFIDIDRQLIFEEETASGFEILDLGV